MRNFILCSFAETDGWKKPIKTLVRLPVDKGSECVSVSELACLLVERVLFGNLLIYLFGTDSYLSITFKYVPSYVIITSSFIA